jgi:hypothetical protein
MKLVLILALSIFISCNPPLNKEKHSFDLIEVTYNTTWNGCTSMRIDSTGTIVKCTKVHPFKTDSMTCFEGHISNVQLDSIDQQIKLLKLQADSILIESNCKDCSEGSILISENGAVRKIRFVYDEPKQDDFTRLSAYVLMVGIKVKILRRSPEFETKKWLEVPHPEKFKALNLRIGNNFDNN